MAVDASRAPVSPATSQRDSEPAGRRWLARLTSIPALSLAFVLVTALAIGPGEQVDHQVNRPWGRLLAPELQPLFRDWLDRIAGQAVCLPILAAVGIVLAWKHRTWRPIVCVVAAELAFYIGVGGMKIAFARPAPVRNDPDFFDGGLINDGWHGISYPSGHAAESVLIYGMAVYLIARWSNISERALRLLVVGVGLIALNTVAVSFWLGWHWVTDLIAGCLAGGLLLRILVRADRRDWRWLRWRRARAEKSTGTEAAPDTAPATDAVTDTDVAAITEPARPPVMAAPGTEV